MPGQNRRSHHCKSSCVFAVDQKVEKAPNGQLILKQAASNHVKVSKANKCETFSESQANPGPGRDGARKKAGKRKNG